MLDGPCAFIRGFLLAAKDHHHAAGGIEFDDHVGAFIGGPDVVLRIDFHSVGEGPGIKVVADFADETAVGAELQKLGGGSAVRLPGGIAARKDGYVSLGIDGSARRYSQI